MTELYTLRILPILANTQISYIANLINQPYLIEGPDGQQQPVHVKWTMQPFLDGCLHNVIEFDGSTPFNENWVLLYLQKLKKSLSESISSPIKMEVTRRLSFTKCIMLL